MYYFPYFSHQYSHNPSQVKSPSDGFYANEYMQIFQIPLCFNPGTQNQLVQSEILPISCLNEHEKQIERRQKPQEVKKRTLNIGQDHSKEKSEQIMKTKNKKKDKDPEFRKRTKKIVKKMNQIPGRNKISNVFRAFVKLISNKIYLESIKEVINVLLKQHRLEVSIKDFIRWVKEHIPNCSNYVNRPEFERVYFSDCSYGILFRVLLRRFLRGEGASYITTVSSRKKIFAQNKVNFLCGMREVEIMMAKENVSSEDDEEDE